MISQIIVKEEDFFKAADGSDVQMSESQSRGGQGSAQHHQPEEVRSKNKDCQYEIKMEDKMNEVEKESKKEDEFR